jgi:RND family efflux transporter MFP subunit
MSKQQKSGVGAVIGYGALAVAIIGAVIFIKTKPEPKQRHMSSMVPVVESVALSLTNRAHVVAAMGTVGSDREVGVEAEVAGLIVHKNPLLIEGGRLSEGDLLLRIDPRDYERDVADAEAALQTAQASLRLEEGQQAVAAHEQKLIGELFEADALYSDLVLRAPQLSAARAGVASAQARLERAKLRLGRTEVLAPFDCVVREAEIDVGDYARTGRTLAELIATDRYFIRATVPVAALRAFPALESQSYRVSIIRDDEAPVEGRLIRLLPGLSAKGRMARVLVEVAAPLALSRPLLIDEYVQLKLEGQQLEGVYVVPREHLRDGARLWLASEDHRLHIVPMTILQGYADFVIGRAEFDPSWKLITSGLPAPVEGMQVRFPGEGAKGKQGPKGATVPEPAAGDKKAKS